MDSRKAVLLAALVGGIAFARKLGQRAMFSKDWGAIIERMPDDAPPKWMFNNVTALRREHERILEQNRQILDGLRRLEEAHGEPRGSKGGDGDE